MKFYCAGWEFFKLGSDISHPCVIFAAQTCTDMENEVILSALCVAENQDVGCIKISSPDEKLKWWKLDCVGMGAFFTLAEAKAALMGTTSPKDVFAYEISEECDLVLIHGDVYRADKSLYGSLDFLCSFASDEVALGILRFIEGWYLVPVKVVGPATKNALRKVYEKGIFDIGFPSFEDFYEWYEPLAAYELEMIVKPLVDIETFEGKVECDLVPVRYLFSMGMMERKGSIYNKV